MRPEPGQVLHFSEDPTITRFVPHVAPTSSEPEAYVWAVGHDRCPDYWFPRACPRAMAWTGPGTTDADRDRIVGPAAATACTRSSTAGWRRCARSRCTPTGCPPPRSARSAPHANAVVATGPVEPLGPPEPVGDLFALHEEAGIHLRVLPNLWPFWEEVTASTMQWSGIRLRNAQADPRARATADDAGAADRVEVNPAARPHSQ